MTGTDEATTAGDEPLYNIGVVARMTGIPMATLRIWERRYGFPQSARTAGGHRLYSEKQVARLRWVKMRSEEGMQTGQAIRALQHQERDGQMPDIGALPVLQPQKSENAASLSVFCGRLTAALLAHNVEQADQILGQVLALYAMEELVFHVVEPAIAEIGQAWMDGRIGIATEHLATNYVRHRLLMWMLSGPPPYQVRPTLLACAPGELHEGSLLILGTLLRRQHWPVAYLGQSVPLPDLAPFVQDVNPLAIVFVAMTEGPARALGDWPRYLPQVAQAKQPIVAYGGRIFSEQPEWRERVPGIFLGPSLEDGLDALQRLLHGATRIRSEGVGA